MAFEALCFLIVLEVGMGKIQQSGKQWEAMHFFFQCNSVHEGSHMVYVTDKKSKLLLRQCSVCPVIGFLMRAHMLNYPCLSY